MTTHFKLATTDEDFNAISELYREYFDFVVSLWPNIFNDPNFGVQKGELKGRAQKFMSPKGCQILAFSNEQLAGCVALLALENTICEIKRLYIRPFFRGQGLGQGLLQAALDQAKLMGYKIARLDSNIKLTSAIKLYPALGFKQIDAYHPDPAEGMLYFEKVL